MRRTLILTVAVLSAHGAGPAVAQQYLGWAGKPAASTHRAASTASSGAPDVIARTVAVAPQRSAAVLPPGPAQPRPGHGLTPAGAWLTPYAAPAIGGVIAYAPPPAPIPGRVEAVVQPTSRPVQPVAPVPAATAAAPVVTTPVPTSDDPMAPRRDAPIFRLTEGRDQPQPVAPRPAAVSEAQVVQPTPSASPSASQGNRYYSVHRQAGRQPDAVAMPQPVYLDALPVELTQPPASQDLAEPGGPPTLIRNADGRVQTMTPATDGDLP